MVKEKVLLTSHHALSHILVSAAGWCPVTCMQEKGNAACGLLTLEIYFAKSNLQAQNGPIRIPKGDISSQVMKNAGKH